MAVFPQMKQSRSGRIVNITSIGGKIAVPHLLPLLRKQVRFRRFLPRIAQ